MAGPGGGEDLRLYALDCYAGNAQQKDGRLHACCCAVHAWVCMDACIHTRSYPLIPARVHVAGVSGISRGYVGCLTPD